MCNSCWQDIYFFSHPHGATESSMKRGTGKGMPNESGRGQEQKRHGSNNYQGKAGAMSVELLHSLSFEINCAIQFKHGIDILYKTFL